MTDAALASRIDRILILDPYEPTAKMLANLLRSVWPATRVYHAATGEQGVRMARDARPQLIFVEMSTQFDGMAFARGLRRSDAACRAAPVIMICGEATAALILQARDAGVSEFIRRPFTMGDLQKRLQAVSAKPRDWIETSHYVGPDRRRFNTADYKGPRRRRSDGANGTQRMTEALKIVQSAAESVEADPILAGRALATQARVLIELCAGQEPHRRMAAAAAGLQAYLQSTAAATVLDPAQISAFAAALIQAAPDAVKPRAAA